jgi:hypothetical protein
MAYQFTIGFYEESNQMQLVEGIQLQGSVTNSTYDYYSFKLFGTDSLASYEISVTPLVGNPDLVLSLNSSNKFPTREHNDFISEA